MATQPGAQRREVSAALARWWREVRRFGSPRRWRHTVVWLAAVARTIARRRRERGLTVAVDVNSLYEPLTGVGWYTHQLLAHLADAPGLRLRLYGESLVEADPGSLLPVVPPPTGAAIERVLYEAPDGLVMPPWRAHQLLRRLAPLLVAADGNRVLFAPNFLPPRLFRYAAGALVATVHDLTLQRFPAAARPDTAAALREGFEHTVLTAALLLTPSETVRTELIARGVAARRVRAVHHGTGQLATVGVAALPPGTPPVYGLHVGTLEPRKNLPVLLAAWRLLRRRLGDGAPSLVLCGGWGWNPEHLGDALRAGVAEGWLAPLGYVPGPGVAALYRHASVVVLPSLYEGFGLPIVEALAAGAPVVASDLPALREVAGEAALFVAPHDIEGWATTLARVLADGALRAALVAAGHRRAAAFDWNRAATAVVSTWEEAARGAGGSADILPSRPPAP